MAALYLFTIEELLDLISKSAAMKSLAEAKRQVILQEIQNPHSDKAQKLYQALVKEQQSYKTIEKNYLTETAQLMNVFQNDITAIKTHHLHQKLQESEQQASQAEQASAEDILKSLN